MKKPLLVAFAGLDGAGKSTQILAVQKQLENLGYKVKIRRHFETKIGASCLNLIHLTKAPIIRTLTFAIDEYAQNMETVNDCSDCDIILNDRSYFCAIAYSTSQNISEDWIWSLYSLADKYDIGIYLDISITASLERKGLDDTSPNINIEQMQNVRNTYYRLVRDGYLCQVNAEVPVKDLTQQIVNMIISGVR